MSAYRMPNAEYRLVTAPRAERSGGFRWQTAQGDIALPEADECHFAP
jgi:hypothetical protein